MYDKHGVLFEASRKLQPENIKDVEKFIDNEPICILNSRTIYEANRDTYIPTNISFSIGTI